MEVLSVSNTSKELEDSNVDTAILPIGAVEQHGPHLPLGTDWIIIQEIAGNVAEKLGACYLLPALPYSNSQEHLGFSGTVSLRPSTLVKVMKDIILSLHLHGVKKVIVISGHGGNWIIKPAVRELNLEYPDMKVIHMGLSGDEPSDLHAGNTETSCMLYLNEQLVRKDEIIDSIPDQTREYLDYVGMKPLSEHGTWGVPSRASKQKGKLYIEANANQIADYARKTLSKLDDLERGAPRRSITPKPPSK